MEGTLVIFTLIGFAFIIFNIYFIFKILQFVIMAINLYKKMVNREDAMIKLLIDIRDNTKKFDDKSLTSEKTNSIHNAINDHIYEKNKEEVILSKHKDDGSHLCDNCNADIPADAKFCPECGIAFKYYSK